MPRSLWLYRVYKVDIKSFTGTSGYSEVTNVSSIFSIKGLIVIYSKDYYDFILFSKGIRSLLIVSLCFLNSYLYLSYFSSSLFSQDDWVSVVNSEFNTLFLFITRYFKGLNSVGSRDCYCDSGLLQIVFQDLPS
jgi:hypothetical protein